MQSPAARLGEEETLAWVREAAAREGVSRYRLAKQVCERLDWRDARGRLQEMACRGRLLELSRRGQLALPAPRRARPRAGPWALVTVAPVECTFAELGAVELVLASGDRALSRIWNGLMASYHPLGAGPLCGAQLRYLVRSAQGWLGALAFSAAARRVQARDAYLGWSDTERQDGLRHMVCNSRFLIAPSVRVKHLASHVLSVAAKRLRHDWPEHYAIHPWALETFVASPHRGTCYRAANWVELGHTTGRGRQDRRREAALGIKRVFVQVLEPRRFPNAGMAAAQAQDWAAEEFGALKLDARLKQRTMRVARDFFAQPRANLPQACGSAARLKGALRLFKHPRVNMQTLLSAHYESTLARLRQEPVVLAVCDSTTLNYSAHPGTEGLGLIGSRQDGPIGLWLHETLAFNPQGVPLGLLKVQHWVRDPADFGIKHKRKQRPIEQKESYKWIESWQAVEAAQKHCPNTQLVMVADRESDVYELFAAARDSPAQLLVRAESDRKVGGPQATLWPFMQAQPLAGALTVSVGKRRNSPARQAELSVRFARVQLHPPATRKRLGAIEVYAVWAKEMHPPAGVEALDWMLLTTVPTLSLEQACERLSWYARRWGIEIYHRTLKSGCRIEDRQLGSADRLEACLAIDMVVAWRVFHLVHLGRQTPDAPCTVYFEEDQWKALLCFTEQNPVPPATPPTLRQAMRRVARLGGFLARKSDGEPGAQTLWLGLQRLDDITTMYRVFSTPIAQAP